MSEVRYNPDHFPIDDFSEDELEMLIDVALYNPEIQDEARQAQPDDRYLRWGKWLVDHGKVSEFPES